MMMRVRRNGKRGFTLVEMLVVLVILGLLVGLIGPRVLTYLGGARADTARVQVQQLHTALQLYTIDMGAPPTADQGLAALMTAPAGEQGWSGPYLDGDAVPLDPWGAAFDYSVDRDTGLFRVTTFGADGAPGGAGDNADISK